MCWKATIAIAHRVTTLDRADLIVVLRDGAVVEMGTRAELLATDGEYARLRRSQAKGDSAEAESGDAAEARSEEPFAPPAPLIETESLSLSRDEAGVLWAAAGNAPDTRVAVRARRCFPFSDPEHFVSLVGRDGRERACVEDPAALSAPVRALLREELERTEFVPRIERVVAIEREATRATWTVSTDRGPWTFVVGHEDAVRTLEDGRRIVTDQDGMRYLVPADLPAASRRLLARVS